MTPVLPNSGEAEICVGTYLRYVMRRPGRGRRDVDYSEVLRVTRAGKRAGNWHGVVEPPRDGFPANYEFLVTREQISDGRYVTVLPRPNTRGGG